MSMLRPNTAAPLKKVWRVSPGAPMGEWVEKTAPLVARPSNELPEVSYGSWVTSSYDLLDGTDVTDDPDTLPGELFDELFAARPGLPTDPAG